MATKKSTAPSPPTKRRYSSQLRQQHARQTREQVLAAAAALFEESGWAGTTVATIAKRAGVAVETVYSGFGSKKQVLRAVVDFAVVGDVEPVPLAEREVFTTLATGARHERIIAGIEMLTDIQERLAKLWRTIGEAAAGDEEIDGWRLEWEAGRRLDVQRSVELIVQHAIDDATLDLLWGIFSHEVYGLFVLDRGLSRAQYAERMRTAVAALVPPD